MLTRKSMTQEAVDQYWKEHYLARNEGDIKQDFDMYRDLTDDEFKYITIEVHKLLRELGGVDADGDMNLTFTLPNPSKEYTSHFQYIPKNIDHSIKDAEKELDVAHFNLNVAMDQVNRAVRTLKFYKEEQNS